MEQASTVIQRKIEELKKKKESVALQEESPTGQKCEETLGMTSRPLPLLDTKGEELERHGIYKRFWGVTAASIDERGVPEQSRKQWAEVKKYLGSLHDNVTAGKGLILIGNVGTMKTTMAVAVLREYIDNHAGGYFIPMVSLLDNLNAAHERHDTTLETRIRKTPLLVLDDMGAEYDHTWVQAKVDAIITERYNRMKATIITSNLQGKDIRDRYQQRIFDRLRATNKLIIFDGSSLRKSQ